jgi:uncharacterized integral membrane protein (TIGR00697 family)
MIRTHFGNFKYLGILFNLNVTFLLVSSMVAGRLISIDGIAVSVAELSFPLCYLIANIITEVYGYGQGRSATWVSIFCSSVALFSGALLLLPPAPDFFQDDAAYHTVFASGPRVAIASVFALFVGDVFNSYVLAKLKVWFSGKLMWLRFIVATIASEGINTILFFGIAFFGIWTNSVLTVAILAGWVFKCTVQFALLPATYPLVRWLKKVENVDYFDDKTNFNPFILDVGKDYKRKGMSIIEV